MHNGKRETMRYSGERGEKIKKRIILKE